jgi:hypothetical protein
VQPTEIQSFSHGFWTNSVNVCRGASPEGEKRDSTPATPVESTSSTPSFEPPRRQDDEESDPFDVNFDENPGIFNEPRRQHSISEDEAEADAYFKKLHLRFIALQ